MGKRKPGDYQAKLQAKVEDLSWMLQRFRRIADNGQEKLVYGHLGHSEMAGTVYMLGRQDLEHQAVVHGARDRIIWLANQVALKDQEIAELQKQLDQEISNRTGNHVGGVVNPLNDASVVKQSRMAALRDVLGVVRSRKNTYFNDVQHMLNTDNNENLISHFKSCYEASEAIETQISQMLERTIRGQAPIPEELLMRNLVPAPAGMKRMSPDFYKDLVERLKISLVPGYTSSHVKVESPSEQLHEVELIPLPAVTKPITFDGIKALVEELNDSLMQGKPFGPEVEKFVTAARVTSKPTMFNAYVEEVIQEIIDQSEVKIYPSPEDIKSLTLDDLRAMVKKCRAGYCGADLSPCYPDALADIKSFSDLEKFHTSTKVRSKTQIYDSHIDAVIREMLAANGYPRNNQSKGN